MPVTAGRAVPDPVAVAGDGRAGGIGIRDRASKTLARADAEDRTPDEVAVGLARERLAG